MKDRELEKQAERDLRLNDTLIEAYLKSRKRNLEQSLSAINISDKKRDRRQYEYSMVCEAINAINKAKEL